MKWRIGTSGWSYDEWVPAFYPEGLSAAKRLAYYAERHDAVEVNATFRRMPTEKQLTGWAKQVPPGFAFVLKAPQPITHFKRLGPGAGEEAGALFRTAACLGERLGPVLFQLPPNMKRDVARLRDFLAAWPDGARGAFEFRHDSWFADDVFTTLADFGAALAWAEGDEGPTPPPVATASFGYLRLRRETYDDAALRAWTERAAATPWSEAWAFFKHDDRGEAPRFAAMLRALAG